MDDDEIFMAPPMKVCPFCGSAQLRVQTVWGNYRYVNCRNCRAAGPVVKIAAGDVGHADEEAVNRWNDANYRQTEYEQTQRK